MKLFSMTRPYHVLPLTDSWYLTCSEPLYNADLHAHPHTRRQRQSPKASALAMLIGIIKGAPSPSQGLISHLHPYLSPAVQNILQVSGHHIGSREQGLR